MSSNNVLYLHIGAPKTGSSAIQKFAKYIAEDTRLKSSISYPDFGIGSDENSRMILKSIRESDIKLLIRINERLMKIAEKQDVFISAEDFFNVGHINGFDNIRKVLSGLNLIVILYVRSHIEIFESAIKQRILNHYKTDWSIPKEYFTRFDWYKTAQSWENGIPGSKIVVRKYD